MATSNSPIIVGGPPRSATTMMLQLLGSHHRIAATQETDYGLVEVLMSHISRYKEVASTLYGFKMKRWASNEKLLYKKMVEELWYATTKDPIRRERIVHKTPCTEKYFSFYHEIFEGEIKLIYCIRNAVSIFRSVKNIVRRPGRPPYIIESVINMYKISVKRYLEIYDKHPQSVLLVQADKMLATDSARLEFGNAVMKFIGEEMDESVHQRLIRNELINPKKKVHELTESELETIHNDPELATFQKMFGYA